MGKTVLSSSGTNYPLNPWVSWYFQYLGSLSPKDRTNKENTLLSYVKQYFALITSSVGGYTGFSNYSIVSDGLRLISTVDGTEEYCFSVSLVSPIKVNKPKQKLPVPILLHGIPTFVTENPDNPEFERLATKTNPVKMIIKSGTIQLATTNTTGNSGSGGSGTPPPPPKPVS